MAVATGQKEATTGQLLVPWTIAQDRTGNFRQHSGAVAAVFPSSPAAICAHCWCTEAEISAWLVETGFAAPQGWHHCSFPAASWSDTQSKGTVAQDGEVTPCDRKEGMFWDLTGGWGVGAALTQAVPAWRPGRCWSMGRTMLHTQAAPTSTRIKTRGTFSSLQDTLQNLGRLLLDYTSIFQGSWALQEWTDSVFPKHPARMSPGEGEEPALPVLQQEWEHRSPQSLAQRLCSHLQRFLLLGELPREHTNLSALSQGWAFLG